MTLETGIYHIKRIGRPALYLYQRAFFYIGNAKNEILKPLGFWNETVNVIILLTVTGYQPSIAQIVFAYVVLMVVSAAIGKVIVAMGIMRYNTRISNHQNEELMQILDEIKQLREQLSKSNDTDV